MQRLNRTRNTLQGSFWGIISKIVSIVFPFIIRTIIIRELGANYSGLSSLFTSILQVLSLAELGIGSAMVYAMYRPIAENDHAKICALLNFYKKVHFIIGGIVFSVGVIITPFIPLLIKSDVPTDINLYILFAIYLVNTVLSYSFLAYKGAILSAYQREADNYKLLSLVNIMTFICQIVTLYLFKNYYIYIIFLPISTILYNYIRYKYVKNKYPQYKCEGVISNKDKHDIKQHVIALACHKVGGVIANTFDTIIISAFLGLVIVSNYNNYYYLLSAVTSIIMIVFSSLTAGIGNGLIVNKKESIKIEFYSILLINGFIVVLCTTCFFSMYQDFVKLWVGEEYLFGFSTVVLFCIYFFIHTIRRTIIMYRDAAGMWIDNMYQPIVSAFVNLTVNIILVNIIGINGIVISTILAMAIIDVPWESIVFFKRKIGDSVLKYFIRITFFAIIAIVSCLCVKFILLHLLVDNIILRLLLEAILSIVISTLIFFVFSCKMPEYKFTKKKILSVINRNHC